MILDIALCTALALGTPTAFPPTQDLHEWTWDASFNADGYRVYVARPGEIWVQVADVTSPSWVMDTTQMPPGMLGVVVTAYNVYGESSTEHGAGLP